MNKSSKGATTTKTVESATKDEIWVVTSDPAALGTRGGGLQSIKVEELAVNVNLFVQQMGKVLESTPEKLGKFHFDEFEVHAEISADGTLGILGSGVHASAGGGVRFVFRRSSASSELR